MLPSVYSDKLHMDNVVSNITTKKQILRYTQNSTEKPKCSSKNYSSNPHKGRKSIYKKEKENNKTRVKQQN